MTSFSFCRWHFSDNYDLVLKIQNFSLGGDFGFFIPFFDQVDHSGGFGREIDTCTIKFLHLVIVEVDLKTQPLILRVADLAS